MNQDYQDIQGMWLLKERNPQGRGWTIYPNDPFIGILYMNDSNMLSLNHNGNIFTENTFQIQDSILLLPNDDKRVIRELNALNMKLYSPVTGTELTYFKAPKMESFLSGLELKDQYIKLMDYMCDKVWQIKITEEQYVNGDDEKQIAKVLHQRIFQKSLFERDESFKYIETDYHILVDLRINSSNSLSYIEDLTSITLNRWKPIIFNDYITLMTTDDNGFITNYLCIIEITESILVMESGDNTPVLYVSI